MAGHPVRRALGFLVGFLALFFLAALCVSALQGTRSTASLIGSDGVVALVSLNGEIRSSDGFVETLEDIREDDGVSALVVRIDSPGGEVAPSQEMYQAMLRLRQEKPVVASLGAVAASGGYYVASAADVIVASPGTLTGSIGVVMMLPDFSGLMEKLGVDAQVITAGSRKAMGSPFQPLSQDERALLQRMVDQVHAQFIGAVVAGRGLDPDATGGFADGRIMTGEEASTIGLVDELGGLERAIEVAGERAGIEGRPQVERRGPSRGPWWWRALFSDQVGAAAPPLGSPDGLLAELATLMSRNPPPPRFLWRLPFGSEGGPG